MKFRTPAPGRGRRGVALIITLGIVALLLILVMSFAFDASSTQNVSRNREEETRARMLSRSAVERAIGLLRYELGSDSTDNTYLNPGVAFYPTTASGWTGRRVLATIEPSFDTDLPAELAVAFHGYALLYADADSAVPGIGRSSIRVTEDRSDTGAGQGGSRIIGSAAYILLDETGKVDPAQHLATDQDETDTAARNGLLASEIQLTNVLGDATLARRLQTTDNSTGHPGYLTPNRSWMSYSTLFMGTPRDQADADSIATYLIPMSVADPEQVWIDVNGDHVATDDELMERLDATQIGSALTPDLVYDYLLGVPAGNSGRDDSARYSPWLKAQNPGSDTEARRLAAQLAVNLQDWADDSTAVTHAYIGGSADDYALTYSVDGSYSRPAGSVGVVHGVEDYIGISKVAVAANYLYPVPLLLHLQPARWIQVATPTSSGVPLAGFEVDVTLSITIVNGLGGSYQVTRTLTVDDSDFMAAGSNGDATYYNMATWKSFPEISLGDVTLNGLTSFLVQQMQIDTIAVTHKPSAGQAFEQPTVRYHGSSGDQDVVASWAESGLPLHALGGLFSHYVMLESKDPLYNARSELDADFADYWTKTPAATPSVVDLLLSLLLGADGYPENTQGYTTYNYYCDAEIANRPFAKPAEFGRVHGLTPNRSLRLWAKAGETSGHDLHLLDLFKFTSATGSDGRISLNSPHHTVLQALAADTALNPTLVADAISDHNGTSGGKPYLYRGDAIDIFDAVPLTASFTRYDDRQVEEAVAAILALTTTRQNYYTIIASSQSLHDLGSLGFTPPGRDVLLLDSDSSHYARILARDKVLAFLYRDAYTNKVRILRYEAITD